MVSTRYTSDYSMAQTRSRTKPKFSFGKQRSQRNSFGNMSGVGTYRQVTNSSPQQFNKSKVNESNRKLDKKSKDSSRNNMSTRRKTIARKAKNAATKLVMPCKLGNKVNCAVHKKLTQQAKGSRTKKGENNKQIKGKKDKFPDENTSRKKVTNKKTSRINNSNDVVKNRTPEKIVVHTNEKVTSPVSKLQRKASSGTKLSPVTFKKNIRSFLKREIQRRIRSTENDGQKTGESREINSQITGLENPQSLTNESKLILRDKSIQSRSRILNPKPSIEKSPESTTNEMISSNVTNSSKPKSRISPKYVNSRGDVPNSDLSSSDPNESTNRPKHSNLQKSKSLESLPLAKFELNEYNTRRSCFYRENILTRNLVRNSKYFKRDVLSKMFKNKVPDSVSPKKPNTSPLTKNKPSNQAQKSPVSSPKSAYHLVSKRKQRVKIRNKTRDIPEVKSPKRQLQNRSPVSEKNTEMQKKMLKLMSKKFGPSVDDLVIRKPNESVTNDQKELDKELVEIVDELAVVDNYVQEKILSFKLRENLIQFPHRGDKKTNALIIHKSRPDTDRIHGSDSTELPNRGRNKNKDSLDGKKAKERIVTKQQKKDKNCTKINIIERSWQSPKKNNHHSSIFEKTKIKTPVPACPQKLVTISPKKTAVTTIPTVSIVDNSTKKVKAPAINTSPNESVEDISCKTTVNSSTTRASPDQSEKTCQKTPSAETALETPDHLQEEDTNDSSTNSTSTHTSKSYVRTKLPLTLKTKIVVSNGKKIKKKLSKNESRIYNLLRCYGDNSALSPVKIPTASSTAQEGKSGEKTKPIAEEIDQQGKPTTTVRDHKHESLKEKPQTESPDKSKEKKKLNAEKDYDNNTVTIPTNNKKHQNESKMEKTKPICEEIDQEGKPTVGDHKHKSLKEKPQTESPGRSKEKKKLNAEKDNENNTVTIPTNNKKHQNESKMEKTKPICEEIDQQGKPTVGDHKHKSLKEKPQTESPSKSKEKKKMNTKKDTDNNTVTIPTNNKKHENKSNLVETKETGSPNGEKKEHTLKTSSFIGSKTKGTASSEKNKNLDSVHLEVAMNSEDTSPNNSRSSIKKIVTPNQKDKRQEHKAKYNIVKDLNAIIVDDRLKMSKKILGTRKEKGQNDEDSEEEWIDEDDGEDKVIEKKGNENNTKEIKKRKGNAHEANATSKKKNQDRNAKEIQTKGNNFEQKVHQSITKSKAGSNDETKSKGTGKYDTKRDESDGVKTRPFLTYNSSGPESSDDNREDFIEDESTKCSTQGRINDSNQSDSEISSINSFLMKCTKKKVSKRNKSPDLNLAEANKKSGNKQEIQSPKNKRSSTCLDGKKSKSDKKLVSKDFSINVSKSPGKRNEVKPMASVKDKTPKSDVLFSKNKLAKKHNDTVVNSGAEGNVHSDADIFDDSVDIRTTKRSISENSTNQSDGRVSTDNSPPSTQATREKIRQNEKTVEFKKIVNEHVNKYKTKDLVENLKNWTGNEIKSYQLSSGGRNKERDGNYRDYATRTGIAQNPVRILKRKACEDLKKQMNNEYKNRHNGKDYFQCICFNKFFIKRVKNKVNGNWDILNVKVKPNKSENITSIRDIEFCTFCKRLYDKYKDNFIIINQEYIMNEFIQRHNKDWNRLNKSYDNDVREVSFSNMSNLCNLSFASTATTPKSCESKTNSWTESRLGSISSDKNDSIVTMGSDFSDYYLNEMFMKQAKEKQFASSHEFQRYKQKCRNVNLKINEICDLYKPSPQYKTSSPRRISSTETRSYVTDEGQDEGVFTRPNTYGTPWQSMMSSETSKHANTSLYQHDQNMSLAESGRRAQSHLDLARTSTPCKSHAYENAQRARDVSYHETIHEDKYLEEEHHYPCTPRKQRHCYEGSDSMEEEHQALCTPKHQTPNSFTCSRTPTSARSSRKDLFRTKIEKTKESFERLFNEVWRKCSPAKCNRKRLKLDDDLNDSPRQRKKQKRADPQSIYDTLTKQRVKRRLVKQMNQSLMSSEVSDEYDADLSDSDGNRCPLNRSYPRDSDSNVVYKKQRRHYVNKLFIKQSSKQLFTNRKTSYSDSEQVIKIHNVKKKVYTTVHRKVYKAQNEPLIHDGTKDQFRDQPCDQSDRRKKHGTATSCYSKREDNTMETTKRTERACEINGSKVQREKPERTSESLRDKIALIQYETLWSKLADKNSHAKVNETREMQRKEETDLSDSVVVTGDEREEVKSKQDEQDSGIYSLLNQLTQRKEKLAEEPTIAQESSSRVSPDTTNEDLNGEHLTLKVNSRNYRTKVNDTSHLMNEILVRKIERQNNYENIKGKIKTYANAVNSKIEPMNKKYVLKLIKSLMKCKEIDFDDYRNALNDLKINVNLNEKNEFLIKVRNQFSVQDETIMKACYEKLQDRYQRFQSELSVSTFNKLSQEVEDKDMSMDNSSKYKVNGSVAQPDADLIETFESFKANLSGNEPKNKLSTSNIKNNETSNRENVNTVDPSMKSIFTDGSITGFDFEISGNDLFKEDLDIEMTINENMDDDLNENIRADEENVDIRKSTNKDTRIDNEHGQSITENIKAISEDVVPVNVHTEAVENVNSGNEPSQSVNVHTEPKDTRIEAVTNPSFSIDDVTKENKTQTVTREIEAPKEALS